MVASGEPLAVAVFDVASFDHDASRWPRLLGPNVACALALTASAIAIPAEVHVLAKPATARDVVERLAGLRRAAA